MYACEGYHFKGFKFILNASSKDNWIRFFSENGFNNEASNMFYLYDNFGNRLSFYYAVLRLGGVYKIYKELQAFYSIDISQTEFRINNIFSDITEIGSFLDKENQNIWLGADFEDTTNFIVFSLFR